MPSQLLHVLYGEDVITGIHRQLAGSYGIVADKALERVMDQHRQVFALGCQGPDIFYHSRGRRPVALEYGTLLHRRGAGTFTAGLLKLGLPDPPPDEEDIRLGRREKGINALGVYALGFMTHAILDRMTHPYIVYKCDRPPSEPPLLKLSHAFFERILDVLMFKRLRGREIEEWDQIGVLAQTCEEPPLGLKELLSRALVMAFPHRAGRDEKLSARIENTFFDSGGFYRHTDPGFTAPGGGGRAGTGIKRHHLTYIYPLQLPPDLDFLNLNKLPWYYPAGDSPAEYRSFPELYDHAVDRAVSTLGDIIERYLHEGYFPIVEAAQAIGNGGLSICGDDGKPCAVTRTDPLPLDEVISRQADLRGI
ncbi:MAG: zinc dependent phospholipase C family protein [Treponema sp.]|nr:zinc dependent phospholipase C family protein [Treponema sp.]